MNKKLDIINFIDNEYRNHGYYTLFNRGIPSFEDGMIPVQRKIFYVVNKSMTKDYEPMLKLIGGVTESGYHHGDKSAFDSAVNMATDYKASNNNINLLMGQGNFGNRQFRESASARYIKVKYNKICDNIYLDHKLHKSSDDQMAMEPRFYHPIIPMILVNQKNGIALGHACYIPPHNPIDIINFMINHLKGRKPKKFKPFWRGLDLDVIDVIEHNKFLLTGKYEIKGDKKVIITELPPVYDRSKYMRVLNNLEEKGIISSYIDNSKGDTYNISVRFKSSIKDLDIIKTLRLYQYITYNLTCIKDSKLKIYDNIYDIIYDFIEYRKEIYIKRYKNLSNELNLENLFITSKISFIKDAGELISNKGLNIKSKDLRSLIKDDKYVDKFMNIAIHRFNDEHINELLSKIKSNNDLLEKYRNINIDSVYIKELLILKRCIADELQI